MEKTKNQGTQIQTQHFLTPTAKIRTSYDDILLLLLLFFFFIFSCSYNFNALVFVGFVPSKISAQFSHLII